MRKTQEKTRPTNFVLSNQEEKLEWKTVSQHFYHNTPFWNQVKKKRKNKDRALEKKKQRMSILCAWNVLEEKEKNKEEKEKNDKDNECGGEK